MRIRDWSSDVCSADLPGDDSGDEVEERIQGPGAVLVEQEVAGRQVELLAEVVAERRGERTGVGVELDPQASGALVVGTGQVLGQGGGGVEGLGEEIGRAHV